MSKPNDQTWVSWHDRRKKECLGKWREKEKTVKPAGEVRRTCGVTRVTRRYLTCGLLRSRYQSLLLHFVQALIDRAGSHQLGVRSRRRNAPFIQHHDAVGDFERVQPMRDEKDRAAMAQIRRRCDARGFRLRDRFDW